MKQYKNTGGNSGALSYEIMADSIKIEFQDGSIYLYTYHSAGKNNVEQMKKLAEKGQGLTTFINVNVHNKYTSKLV